MKPLNRSLGNAIREDTRSVPSVVDGFGKTIVGSYVLNVLLKHHALNVRKNWGIGACKGSLPENFVAELRSLEKAKVEAQREALLSTM